MERLWKLDVMPFKNEKLLVRSKEDKYAIDLLDQKTTRVGVNGVQRYATPLLRRTDMPCLRVPSNVVHNYLKSTERRLSRDPQQATIYQEEMKKLVTFGRSATQRRSRHRNRGTYLTIKSPTMAKKELCSTAAFKLDNGA